MLRAYWYGDGHILRVPINAPAPMGALTEDALAAVAAGLGYPTRLDGSRQAAGEEGVLVFGPAEGYASANPPGREDLDAEAVVIWVRERAVTALLFARTIGDLSAILAMIAAYEQAIEEISVQGAQARQRRVAQAPQAPVVRPIRALAA
jgi:hypothetical protein